MRRAVSVLMTLLLAAATPPGLAPALAGPSGTPPGAAAAGGDTAGRPATTGAAAAQQRGTGVLPSMAAPGSGLVRLQVGAFDPTTRPGPAQPGVPRVAPSALAADTAYPWLVQVRDGRYAEVTRAVTAAGATVLSVVPDATYLVRATPRQRAAFAGSPAVRWSGLLQPAWKLPVAVPGRAALLALRGSQTFRVYGFRGTPEAARLATALRGIPGVTVVSDAAPVVDVRATAAALPAIAALPGVQWVGVRPTAVPHNADARWVNDTGVRDVRWATAPGRLTGAGQTAAVADTGLNYTRDLNGRAHAAFRQCEDGAAPRTDALGTCKAADYSQAAPGGSEAEMTAVRDDRAGSAHRKMVAYFDIGGTGVSPRDESAHGTHVAGSVAADYLANGVADGHDGMAPAARLVFQAIGTESGGLALPDDDYQLWRQAYRPSNPADVPEAYTPSDYAKYRPLEDARTHNNSYGLIAPVVDDGSANALDEFVWDHEDMSVVVSAGNAGPSAGSIGSPSVAKNNLSSCASANGRQPMASIDTVAVFSSHGPTGDGRFGPDVCTPGQVVLSAKGGSSGDDHYLQGTSMSGPVLTGLVTLVRQYFWDGYGPAGGAGLATGAPSTDRRWNPSAALVKAVTVNGAERMRGRYSGDDGSRPELDGQWPSQGQGFGLVNLRSSLYFPGAERTTWYRDAYRADPEAFAVGASTARSSTVQVAAGQPLDVTLAWTDAPTGAPAGTPALVNDLDLEVVGPGGTYVGNNTTTRAAPSAAVGETPPNGGSPDRRNLVERVRINAPQAGTYTIRVRPRAVARGPQGFALAATGRLSATAAEPAPSGQPLQVDVAGDPTISGVAVERVSADTSMVRFTTSEPTTATGQLVGGGETLDVADVYTHSNAPGSRFRTAYATGPVETSPVYEDRPVPGTRHEMLLYGLKAGTSYALQLTVRDLAERTATASTTFTSPGLSFQPLARDIGQLSEGATDNVPSTVASGTGWQTGTQLYAGYNDGPGILGAFMFRLPASVDPAAVHGAVVELIGAHVLASLYDADPRITLDLLPESEEARWGTQNYRDLHSSPAVARVRPESALLRGGGEKRVFSFTCADLARLRESLAVSGTERRAAFRLDSSLVPLSLPSYEFGFNRRSKGPQLRPRLVLLGAPSGASNSTTPCDPGTPAPAIDDVGVATGTTPDAVTVSWRTQVPSDSTVLFRERGATSWTQVSTPARATTHEVQVLGLDPARRYEFGVRSTSCNGLTTTADNAGAGWDFFRPPPPAVRATTRWFTGQPSDQAAKATGPTATFQEAPPSSEPPRTQTTTGVANEDFARNPLTAFWEGAYSGAIDGDLVLSWYWSSRPGVTQARVSITVFKDVPAGGEQTSSIIGRESATVSTGPTPTLSTARVPVKGTVGERLLIQVAEAPGAANQLVVHYGAASTPSRMDIPLDPRPPTQLLPRVGPKPPPSAGAGGLGLSAVATRDVPTGADVAAGTARCGTSDVAASPSASPSISASASASASPGASPSAGPGATPTASPGSSPTASPGPPGPGSSAPPAGRFHPVTPARVLDTRVGGSRVVAGADREVQITGRGGIPETGVVAAVLNVTVTGGSGRGDVQVYPTGQRPTNRTSNLNYPAGVAVPVQVQTGVGTGGRVSVSVNAGNAHVVVDVFGYYGDSSDSPALSSGYTALRPERLLDTRLQRAPVRAGADRAVRVSGLAGVPADATAVALNASVLGTPANADLQVYPTGRRPAERTSNLNVRRGQTRSNAVVSAIGTGGSITLSISQNTAHVVLDVLGYYSVSSRGRFVPLTPARLLDTRQDRSPVRAGQDRVVPIGGRGGVPADAQAAVLSVTGTDATAPADLQVYPTGDRPANRTATSAFRPGEAVANLAMATLGSQESVSLSLSQGSATVVLDVLGYLTDG